MNDDVFQVNLRLEHRQLAVRECIRLLDNRFMIELANHGGMLVLTSRVEDNRRNHRWVHIEVVKNLPVASGIDPSEMQSTLSPLCLVTNALNHHHPLLLLLFFVINLNNVKQ